MHFGSVKNYWAVAVADKIEAITKAGMVVFGHIGLTPQSSASMGGFKAQGRTTDSANKTVSTLMKIIISLRKDDVTEEDDPLLQIIAGGKFEK